MASNVPTYNVVQRKSGTLSNVPYVWTRYAGDGPPMGSKAFKLGDLYLDRRTQKTWIADAKGNWCTPNEGLDTYGNPLQRYPTNASSSGHLSRIVYCEGTWASMKTWRKSKKMTTPDMANVKSGEATQERNDDNHPSSEVERKGAPNHRVASQPHIATLYASPSPSCTELLAPSLRKYTREGGSGSSHVANRDASCLPAGGKLGVISGNSPDDGLLRGSSQGPSTPPSRKRRRDMREGPVKENGERNLNETRGESYDDRAGARSTPPDKRAKRRQSKLADVTMDTDVEEDDSAHPSGIHRHPKHDRHWEEDGNVIVSLGDMMYRLYRGRLARESEWFSDGFKRVTSVKGKGKATENDPFSLDYDEETRMEVVFVDLNRVGVCKKDWETLMDMVDDAVIYLGMSLSMDKLTAILRASHLLRFNRVEVGAKRVLRDAWSDDLDRLRKKRRVGSRDAAAALAIARTCGGLPGVVKRSMYQLLKDESLGQGQDSYGKGKEGETGRVGLATGDIVLLISARAKLQKRWMNETAQYPEALLPCPHDTTYDASAEIKGGCVAKDPLAAREAHRKLVIASGFQDEWVNDVMGGLEALQSLPWGDEGKFCMGCVEELGRMWHNAREQTWDDCEGWFDIVR
ncbi:hypothetical protein D9611_010707 [Ephemerocybe angulata]|uniref:BTB domain-containing protein n=1 Tax=Ephemerocybe angulata TaxID=980116 RepID=A0A8H5BCH2_9AGAR|nr:hypothetical protein D9611_010707 [Tulosesus angulatus]